MDFFIKKWYYHFGFFWNNLTKKPVFTKKSFWVLVIEFLNLVSVDAKERSFVTFSFLYCYFLWFDHLRPMYGEWRTASSPATGATISHREPQSKVSFLNWSFLNRDRHINLWTFLYSYFLWFDHLTIVFWWFDTWHCTARGQTSESHIFFFMFRWEHYTDVLTSFFFILFSFILTYF